MKLRLYQKQELKEIEIDVSYPTMTKRLSTMLHYIRQYEFVMEAFINGKIIYIPLEQILYFDTTDRKVFLYTEHQVYKCKKTLAEIESELINTTVVRINKGTLLNISALAGVSPYPNHRLLAELNNGEHLIISRKYISILQNKIRGKYYD